MTFEFIEQSDYSNKSSLVIHPNELVVIRLSPTVENYS